MLTYRSTSATKAPSSATTSIVDAYLERLAEELFGSLPNGALTTASPSKQSI